MTKEFTINRVIHLNLSPNDIHPYDDNETLQTYNQTFSNDAGIISNYGTNISWYINFKELLGDLYDEYEYFNLELTQFTTIPDTIAADNIGYGSKKLYKPLDNNGQPEYRILNAFISGLYFVNSSYDVKAGHNKTIAHLTTITNQIRVDYDNGSVIEQTGLTNWRNDEVLYETQKGYANNNLLFKKQQNATIKITFGSLESGLTYTPETAFPDTLVNNMPHYIAKFNITPFK